MLIDDVLKKLKDGVYDGGVSEREVNGTSTTLEINDGIPQRVYLGRTQRFFDGKENTKSYKSEVNRFETDEQKKEFIQKVWLHKRTIWR